jgi:hypothetical protein
MQRFDFHIMVVHNKYLLYNLSTTQLYKLQIKLFLFMGKERIWGDNRIKTLEKIFNKTVASSQIHECVSFALSIRLVIKLALAM